MTTKITWVARLFSGLFWLLRAGAAGLRRGTSAALRGLYEFVLISGSYPSLTRDPGITAYRLLEGHPRRSRPFRAAADSAGPAVAPHSRLQFTAFL